MKRLHNQKGFTLIELLVVIAIIGILAAVGVPAFQGFQAKAKYNASKENFSNAKIFVMAEVSKCNSNSGTYAYVPGKTTVTAPAALICPASSQTDATNAQQYFAKVIEDKFNNPYASNATAYTATTTATTGTTCTPGQMNLSFTTTTMKLQACFGPASVGGTNEFSSETISILE